jgi:hypothetical protein
MYHYLLTAKRVGCKMQLTNWLLIWCVSIIKKANCVQYIAIVSLGSFDYLKSCTKWQKGKGLLLNEVSSWRLHGKEHARAKQKGIQQPMQKRRQMLIMMSRLYDWSSRQNGYLLGTHNEESTYNLIEHMKSVDTKDERILGQLYGMSDNIS